MSEYCTNCKTLADLNINQAKTINELQGKLAACEKALAHPIIRKVALAGGLIDPVITDEERGAGADTNSGDITESNPRP